MLKTEDNNLKLARRQSGHSMELFRFLKFPTSDLVKVVKLAPHKESDGEPWRWKGSIQEPSLSYSTFDLNFWIKNNLKF